MKAAEARVVRRFRQLRRAARAASAWGLAVWGLAIWGLAVSSLLTVGVLTLLLRTAPAAAEETPSAAPAASPLPEPHQRWLEEVDLLMTDAEREVFLGLEESYQRDQFIRRFWKARDPFPTTARNELQESWEARVAKARELFGELTGERSRTLLTFGPPSRQSRLLCTELLKPIEVWEYEQGSDRIRGFFTLVFTGFGRGPYDLWDPGEGLWRLASAAAAGGAGDEQLARRILSDCSRGDEILQALAQSLDLSRLGDDTALLPRPSDEWVRSFAARSTSVPEGAERLTGELSVTFPGRHQSRTVVQGVVAVPKTEVAVADVGAVYNLLIDGEVLRKGELFEQFRYRFSFPADGLASDDVPLIFQRYLRPGRYELIVKVEDVNSRRVFRDERELEVPRVERSEPAAVADHGAPPAAAAIPGAASLTASTTLSRSPLSFGTNGGVASAAAAPPMSATGRRVATLLGEANASLASGDHAVKLLALPDQLTVGKLRVEARVRGDGVSRVAFELNDRPVMRKTTPPYSVELDLGDKPRIHRLRAVALDDRDRELATDEVLINSGPHRFSVRLLEPQQGKLYRTSVRAHVEVQVPEGEQLDRVELYLNETLVATLYQPPFEQPLLLDDRAEVSYVRAVAYLKGESSTEDVRFINAPDFIDEVEVQFVELYTTVLDRKGDFVEGLTAADFSALEDGEEQQVRRFETMRDLPIRAGLVLDTSLSMVSELRQVKLAAYRFFETVLTPRDRAALISFSDQPHLLVRFTSDKEILAGGLAGLVADGETALYDSIVYALHYFSGLRGKRAIVVLTDGEDSCSTYAYEDAVDFARRTGVAVYVIGLNLQSKNDVRLKMHKLAEETGGELFLIDSANQLAKVYESIQLELRSQYLIAYQSPQSDRSDEFRRVEVKVHRPGLEAKTIRGYYP